MAEQFLHCADVVAALQQMRRKRMPESMRCRGFGQARIARGLLHRALHRLILNVVTARLVTSRILCSESR